MPGGVGEKFAQPAAHVAVGEGGQHPRGAPLGAARGAHVAAAAAASHRPDQRQPEPCVAPAGPPTSAEQRHADDPRSRVTDRAHESAGALSGGAHSAAARPRVVKHSDSRADEQLPEASSAEVGAAALASDPTASKVEAEEELSGSGASPRRGEAERGEARCESGDRPQLPRAAVETPRSERPRPEPARARSGRPGPRRGRGRGSRSPSGGALGPVRLALSIRTRSPRSRGPLRWCRSRPRG